MPDAPLPPLPPAGQARWRTVAADLRRRLPAPAPLAAAIAAAALAVVLVGGFALLGSRPAGPAGAPAATPAPPEPVGAVPVGAKREPEELVVDVAGAVARPGLVHLRPGSRVADAVAAAGGPAADAVLVGLNQARVLADGEQVRVARTGEVIPPPPSAGGAAGPGGPAAPVDLNRASVAELDGLPGVGPATAAAIVAWRDGHGRFRKVDDLLEVPGIGPSKLERLRPGVRV